MISIALVVPPGYGVPHAQFCLERLGFGYLASPLRRAGHVVEMIDGILEELDWQGILARTCAMTPSLVGISLMSHHGGTRLGEFVGELRRLLPTSHICLGGMFPSLNYKQLLEHLPEIDSVSCGEGEATIVALADAIANGRPWSSVPGLAVRHLAGVRRNPGQNLIDLDDLPAPERDQLPGVLSRGGPATLISSRGCYARCTFCTIEAVTRSLYPRPQRYRSPKSVVDEMQALLEKYNARKFYFVDENFIGPGNNGRARAKAIASEILRRQMRISFSIECRCMDVEVDTFRLLVDAGLQRVFLGVESTEQDELDLFRKAQNRAMVDRAITTLRSLGVHVEIGFILFTPWSTLETLQKKRQFLAEFGPGATASLGSYLSIMPGTCIEGQLRRQGLLCGGWPSYWFEFMDRRASVLFGLVQRELTDPWADALERLLGYQWSQPFDWGLKHAHARTGNPGLLFLEELLAWTASARLKVFDRLMAIVTALSLPADADSPPAETLNALRDISAASHRAAAECGALLTAFEQLYREEGRGCEAEPVVVFRD